jgi:glycerophosphoryl diester phosphodiesterase
VPQIPNVKIEKEIKGAKELTNIQKKLIDGLYLISDGKQDFGDTAVVKWNGNSLSIFVKKEQTYFVLYGGEIQKELVFAGYWRYSLSEELGFIKLIINESTSQKILNNEKPQSIRLNGEYHLNNQIKTISITYLKQLKNDSFYIIAHRGGGRNIDRLPASENSVELIEFAESLGANAIEIDVQLTKDSVPVLFHDEYFSKRLINQDFFIGKVSDYTYDLIESFVTLKNNEKIPTFEEALSVALYKTNLKAVWIDVKSAEVVGRITQTIIDFQNKAKQAGRSFEIFLGIPEIGVLNSYLNHPDKSQITALCEMEPDIVEQSGALIWAPRWSLGLQTEEINNMHSKGKKVFTWTLDENVFIRKFIQKGSFDGILTNYPFLVAYEYYTN